MYIPSLHSTAIPLKHNIDRFLSQREIKMKAVFASLMLVALLFSFSLLQTTIAASSFCDSKCGVRCSKANAQESCLKYCGICCEECKCVPSGTYGHKDECPCYRDKKNSKGNPKCP